MTTEVGCRSWRRSVEWKDGFEEGRRVLFGALGLEIALGRVGEVSGGARGQQEQQPGVDRDGLLHEPARPQTAPRNLLPQRVPLHGGLMPACGHLPGLGSPSVSWSRAPSRPGALRSCKRLPGRPGVGALLRRSRCKPPWSAAFRVDRICLGWICLVKGVPGRRAPQLLVAQHSGCTCTHSRLVSWHRGGGPREPSHCHGDPVSTPSPSALMVSVP